MLKTLSVMTAPPRRIAISMPSSVMIGVRLERNPCLSTTRRLRKPLGARRSNVVFTHRLEQIPAHHACVDQRRRRARARTTGRMRCLNQSRAPSEIGTYPVPGSHPSFCQNSEEEQEAQPEYGGGDAERARKSSRRAIDERAALDRRKDADAHPYEHPESPQRPRSATAFWALPRCTWSRTDVRVS